MTERIAFIGFGEAGATFARAAHLAPCTSAFDVDPARTEAISRAGLEPGASARSALCGASAVLSLVTAGQALAAARDYAPLLTKGALWLDMNSVAPGTKRAAALAIETAGARYVDVSVLAPVVPARLAVPILVAGPHADAGCAALRTVGFTNIRVVGDEVGRASAIKMIRSVMVKGIEALTDEMMSAAEAAGVAEEVLSSLDASERAQGWTERAAYNRERMATHGLRRAEEMEESVETLQSFGIDPVMTRGTVLRQRAAATRPPKARNAA